METLACVLNHKPEKWLIPVAVVSNDIVFIMSPVLSFLYYVFVNYWISPNKNVHYSKKKWFLLPMLFNLLVCFVNLFQGGLIFSITESNSYERGSLFFVPFFTTLFYLIATFLFIIKNKRNIMKLEFIPLLLFGIFPGIGGVIQALFYGTLLMWSSAALTLVMVFIYIQQKMMQLDPLTGAWAKGSFERYLEKIAAKKDNEYSFGIIFIDLDKFKQINDTYGHLEGDCALKSSVEIIKSVIRKTDIVARFGGDEFAVIIHHTSREEIQRIVKRIASSVSQYNSKAKKAYQLEYSVGYGLYDSKKYNIWQFVNYVDHLMYQNKQQKARALARQGTTPPR